MYEDPNVKLRRELITLLNTASRENLSNTPDFMLADFMLGCLETYERVVSARAAWSRVLRVMEPDVDD